jgi:hypothetical protein
MVLVLALLPAVAQAGPVFASEYSASATITDALQSTTMTIAFDGVNYWSSSGGGASGVRYAQYTSGGALVNTFSPGLDFRSVFTDGAGDVYAREYLNSAIYKQGAPGVFSPYATLSGGSLDSQSAVVLDSAGTRYIAMEAGTVYQWDLAGSYMGSLGLVGWGGGDTGYPQDRGIAAAGGYYLTYGGSGVLSAWDPVTGNRVDQTTLLGAGTGFDSYFSLSYAGGRVWVVDEPGGMWRGYEVGLGGAGPGPNPIPEPATATMLACGLCLLLIRKVRG